MSLTTTVDNAAKILYLVFEFFEKNIGFFYNYVLIVVRKSRFYKSNVASLF